MASTKNPINEARGARKTVNSIKVGSIKKKSGGVIQKAIG